MNKRKEPQEICIGDILLNLHASERNPLRKSVVTGINGQYVFCLCPYKKTLKRVRYYLNDVRYDEDFQIIGNIDLEKWFNNALEEGGK